MLFIWKNAGTQDSYVDKLQEVSLAASRLVEKDLENLVAKRIDELVRTDQLMLITQERRRKEEPDILALDETGTLFIFELKRWQGKTENILQALRYGQKFGRYEYDRLNGYYQSYSRATEQRISLQDAHARYFELSAPLAQQCFNKSQHFVIVTNGLDYDTWDAVAYWKANGLRISALIYRLFRIAGEIYIDFDPYGPVPDAPKEAEGGLFVVNTNSTYMPEAYREMVSERMAAAYYERKYAIQNIRERNTVCLYHVGVGILGIGVAKSEYQKRAVGNDPDEEYYVPIDFEHLVDVSQPTWKSMAVAAWEINSQFQTGYRFRQTVFQLPPEFADFIKRKFAEKGVK